MSDWGETRTLIRSAIGDVYETLADKVRRLIGG